MACASSWPRTTSSPRYFKPLLPALAREPERLSLFYEIRPTITRAQARALRRAGVDFVQAGIESLHSDALRAMNKGVAAWQNIQCLKWCRQFGLAVSWYIITRMPGEQDAWNEAQCARIPLLFHLPPPRFEGVVRPDRHIPYYRRAAAYGLELRIKPGNRRLFDVPLGEHSRFVFHIGDTRLIRQMEDPLDFAFRPHLQRLKQVAGLWRRLYSTRKPRLDMRPCGETLCVTDTRFTEHPREYALEGLLRETLLVCDAAPTRERLLAHFSRQGVRGCQGKASNR